VGSVATVGKLFVRSGTSGATRSKAIAIGRELSKKKESGIKVPTPEDLKKDMNSQAEKLAEKFVSEAQKLVDAREIDTKVLSKILRSKKPITTSDLKSALAFKGKKAYICNGNARDSEESFKEMWWVVEKGRKDLHFMPKPVLKKLYKEFRSTYIAHYKKLLKNEKH